MPLDAPRSALTSPVVAADGTAGTFEALCALAGEAGAVTVAGCTPESPAGRVALALGATVVADIPAGLARVPFTETAAPAVRPASAEAPEVLELAERACEALLRGETADVLAEIDETLAEVELAPGAHAALGALRATLLRLSAHGQAPDAEAALMALVTALDPDGPLSAFAEVLEGYVALHPHAVRGHDLLARVSLGVGDTVTARREALTTLRLQPATPAAHRLMAHLLETEGQPAWAALFLDLAKAFEAGEEPARPSLPTDLPEELAAVLRGVHPRVSACLIIKNEAKRLPTCLESLAGFVDEICVLDTGSADDSRAVAEAAGARVTERRWDDDFAAARNAGLLEATGDWVLVIDADERLVVSDVAAWRVALRDYAVGGYALDQVNDHDDGEVRRNPLVRLFQRRADLRFEGHLHEVVDGTILAAGLGIKPLAAASLDHDGYRASVCPPEQKQQRNLTVTLRGVRNAPESLRPWALLGVAAYAQGDRPLARAAFRQLARRFPTGCDAERHGVEPLLIYAVLAHTDEGHDAAALAMIDQLLPACAFGDGLLVARADLKSRAGDALGARVDLFAAEAARTLRGG